MVSVPSLWPADSSALQQLLGIHVDGKCNGETKTSNQRCRNNISKETLQYASKLLNIILGAGNFDAIDWSELRDLACRLLCKRQHQNQADELASKWHKGLGTSYQKTPDRPDRCGVSARNNNASPQGIASQAGQIGMPQAEPVTKPQAEPFITKRPQRRSTDPLPSLAAHDSARGRQNVDIPSIELRSKRVLRSPTSTTTHEFKPFQTRRSVVKLNEAVKNKIASSLSSTDLKATEIGWVYGYCYPADHTVKWSVPKTRCISNPIPEGDDSFMYIKIGHTKNLTTRMKQFQRKCGYTPQVYLESRMQYQHRYEKLVHLSLDNFRCRENTCWGCGVSHQEWLYISRDVIQRTMKMWANWALKQPYRDDGSLKDEWCEKLKSVDLTKADCWEDFVGEKKQQASKLPAPDLQRVPAIKKEKGDSGRTGARVKNYDGPVAVVATVTPISKELLATIHSELGFHRCKREESLDRKVIVEEQVEEQLAALPAKVVPRKPRGRPRT